MTIWNLGSINADFIYSVPHLPQPGETLSATGRRLFLGGKGANMSVAATRAGAKVCHIGAVGADGHWAVERLQKYGVNTQHVTQAEVETAQAIIAVDTSGENQIILHPGANEAIPTATISGALSLASAGDWLIFQNETNGQLEAAEIAREKGLRVAYAAAPFQAAAVQLVMRLIDLLVLNEVEAAQLQLATGLSLTDLPVSDVIMTQGAKGATWFGREGVRNFPAIDVTPVDTTGAGDTFTGYVLAGMDRGHAMPEAITLATRAAAIMVTRHGTADVIPDLAEVQAFRP